MYSMYKKQCAECYIINLISLPYKSKYEIGF